jgi:Acetyltransferase (GNAT) domain
MRIELVDPRTDPRWARRAAESDGGLFTSPPWIRAVCDTYGFTPTAAVGVDADGVPRCGWSWVSVRDLRGDRRISMPFSDRAEPLAASAGDLRRLVDPAISPLVPLTVRCLISSAALFDPRFRQVSSVAWHGTELRGDMAHMVGLFSCSARRNVARAQAMGLNVQIRDDLDAVGMLHEMHVELRARKYRLLAQPLEFFETVWKEFAAQQRVVTLIAEHDHRPIAAALLLHWGDVVYYKFGASRSAHLQLRPNDAIFCAAIGWALERGARLLDWGVSDDDQPGLVAFKDKWASRRDRVLTLRAGGEDAPARPEAGRLFERVTELFTDPEVPPATTRAAGELLYRYFC